MLFNGWFTGSGCVPRFLRKYIAMQQTDHFNLSEFLTISYIFVFLSKHHSVKTALKPSSYRSKFSSTRKTSPAVKKVKGSSFMLRASLCYQLHYLTYYLTHNFCYLARMNLPLRELSRNSILQQVYFEKEGSCSTLCNVCYSKNKNRETTIRSLFD